MSNDNERLRLYTSIVPNERQLALQELKFYAFIHYTVNTFTGKEWGNGKENPSVFNPTAQDTDQWCRAISSAGMKGIILTCKHHDGFCLWQTKTTEHCIRNSPYKNGQGDVVKELSDSCKKYGLKFGVYLSPWDRNAPCYGTPEYNDLYIAQLTELLTNYGEIFMLWLDGACGAAKDGKAPQKYDFPRIWSTALKLQPKICLSNCAPDVRWVGNESGVSRESEWNVVPRFLEEKQNLAPAGQSDDDMKGFQKRCVDVLMRDLGSRSFLADFDDFVWYPAEVDVSIRKGWFHHGAIDFTTKSLRRLMKIYYGAVGGNSLLLLNVPPTKKGLISKADCRRLRQMGDCLKKERELMLENAIVSETQGTERGFEVNITFPTQAVDRLYLEEDTTFSQRVERFSVYDAQGEEKLLATSTVIGFGRMVFFKPIETSALRIVITECRLEPKLKKVQAYKSGAYRLD